MRKGFWRANHRSAMRAGAWIVVTAMALGSAAACSSSSGAAADTGSNAGTSAPSSSTESSAPTAAASNGAAGVSSSSPTSSANATPIEIRVGDVSANAHETPLYVAIDEGFFKDAGLNVTLTSFHGGSAAVAALATGSIDMATGGLTTFISAMAKKAVSGKVIGQSAGQDNDIVAAKGITDFKQLKGKIIGVSGTNSADQILFVALLSHYGLSKSDVTFVTSGTTPERLTALSVGKIEATTEPQTSRPSSEKIGTVILKAEDNPVQIPSPVYFATDAFMKANAGQAKNFMDAILKATAWIKDPSNLTQAVADCVKGTGSPEVQCEDSIKDSTLPGSDAWTDYKLNMSGIDAALDAVAALIPAAKSLTPADVADPAVLGGPAAG